MPSSSAHCDGRQDDVGQRGRLGQEDVGHDEQVQRPQPVDDPVGVRSRHGDVAGQHEQHPDAARGAEPVEHLVRGAAGPGQLVGVDAPHGGDMCAGGRVVQPPVPGELVGLLAVLAAALPVALAGDRAVAGARPPDQPERERQVQVRLRGVGAVAVLFGAAGGEDHRRPCPAQPPDCGAEVGLGDAGQPLDPFGPVRVDPDPDGVEPGGAQRDVRVVDQPLAQRDMEHPVGQGQVRAGQRLQVQMGPGGRGRAPRVDHDVPRAVDPAGVQVLHGRWHGVGRVGADEQDGPGVGDVGERERQPAVEPERPVDRGRRRGHAEPAVVVDGRRAQRDADELAQRVRLLVGQPAAAERADAVRPVPVLGVLDGLGDAVERLVPAGGTQRSGALVPDQRRAQPVGVLEQVGGGPALGAQAAAVGREVVGLEPSAGQPHAALQGAVGAVRRGHAAHGWEALFRGPYATISLPYRCSYIVEMWIVRCRRAGGSRAW